MFNVKQNVKNYFFQRKLKFESPDHPQRELSDIWTGNFERGKEIVKNIQSLANNKNMHSFNFIRDLKSYGTIEARSLSRKLVNDWIEKNNNVFSSPFSEWFLSERITIICFNYSWFAKSGKEDFKKKLLSSLSKQIKIQEFNFNNKKIMSDIPLVLKSVIIGNIFLFADVKQIEFFLKKLEKHLRNHIFEDGGHISRCPQKQIDLLRNLIEIRSAISVIPEINTNELHNKVNLLSNYFKMFCMPDNSFGYFNGGSLIHQSKIIETLKRVGSNIKKFQIARQSGYAKIRNKDLTILIDLGQKKENINFLDFINKASIGAFELFFKKFKLVTNLGDLPNSFQKNKFDILSSTAAHSTLCIDDRNNIDLSGNRKIETLNVTSNDHKQGTLIEIEHDGYKSLFGINHTRTIFISKDGLDVRGEDFLKYCDNIGITPKSALIRFHLSPFIETYKLQSGKILLKYQNELIFHFLSTSDSVEIEKTSIFKNGKIENSQQIIINLPILNIQNIKEKICSWSFKFEKNNL